MSRPLLLIAFLLLLAGSALAAATLEPGAALPRLELVDQNDRPFELPPATRSLLFAADRAGSDLAGQALEGFTQAQLDAMQLRYVADISAMPSLITKMFALPALRSRAYAVGLVRDASLTAAFPREQGAVTVLRFADGRLVSVAFAHNVGDLRKAMIE